MDMRSEVCNEMGEHILCTCGMIAYSIVHIMSPIR